MWCANFGFSESALVDAAIEQFRVLPYYHSLIDKTTEPMGRLAERLKASTHVPMARVFFANSGSEANDTLVKLTWYYHNAIGKPEKKKIISRFMGFHGVTCGAASVTGIPQMHTDFDLPVNDLFFKTDCPHFYRYGEPGESEEDYATRLAANLEELIVTEGPETVAAFFAEPVMGGGGCIVPPRTYFEKVQAVLDKYEVLFFADEVITGSGRTGNWLGSETFNIRPDGLSLAKGLASAYQPISAVMINQKLYDAMLAQSRKLGFFAHAFTTTGHPVAVAVALRCQELMEERDVLGNVRRVGGLLQEAHQGLCRSPAGGDHPRRRHDGRHRAGGGQGNPALLRPVVRREGLCGGPRPRARPHHQERARRRQPRLRPAAGDDRGRDGGDDAPLHRRPRRHHPLGRGERPANESGGVAADALVPDLHDRTALRTRYGGHHRRRRSAGRPSRLN